MSAFMAKSCSIDTILAFLDRIRHQEKSSTPIVLHYDHDVKDLRPWLWYVNLVFERIHLSPFV
jgi:hypothetical protein